MVLIWLLYGGWFVFVNVLWVALKRISIIKERYEQGRAANIFLSPIEYRAIQLCVLVSVTMWQASALLRIFIKFWCSSSTLVHIAGIDIKDTSLLNLE